jgi:hypothetical protein
MYRIIIFCASPVLAYVLDTTLRLLTSERSPYADVLGVLIIGMM